jgi:hypothetical protein
MPVPVRAMRGARGGSLARTAGFGWLRPGEVGGLFIRGEAGPVSVRVDFRPATDGPVKCRAWDEVSADVLGAVAPWRTFRWYEGQKHYSGIFWSATERGHVIYESRLELARLLFADFDKSVRHIVAQPFLLRADFGGVERKHVPDYLLFTGSGPVVVDVKPRHRLTKPVTAVTFGWTRRAVESRGWRYEVWSEPPQAELDNVRFLAGYRRDWLIEQGLLRELLAADLDGATLGEAFRSLPERPEPVVRAAVLHLLWRQDFTVDLTRPLSGGQVLRRTV